MKAELVAEYLSSLKRKTGLTYEAIAEKSNRSESSVKNLCLGKSDDPRIDTVAPIVYALGGSMDEMLNPEKSKDELKETSVIALKDSYEYQATLLKESNELHINNIRSHYEQHHEDLKENYEKRLADKRELIETKDAHIKTLEKECFSSKLFSWICILVLVSLLIAEVMNPNLGWFRY
jgi:transcriptional regulator with XRE-family HTH domain